MSIKNKNRMMKKIVVVTDDDRNGAINSTRPDAANGVDEYLLNVARKRRSGEVAI